MSLLKYNQFILENSNQEIEILIEDTFTAMCDNNGLDFRIMQGWFVNTYYSDEPNTWITDSLLPEVEKVLLDNGFNPVKRKAFQITFMKSESWSHHWFGEISDDKKIENLNKDFQEGLNRFNRFNTNFRLVHLPDEIKPTFWQIVFYVVEN